MKKLVFLFVLIFLSTSVLAYYSNTGTYDGRTRIDVVGYGKEFENPNEAGATGGHHPVTATYTAPYSGYIGAFDLPANIATLNITKTASPNPVNPGGQITYTIVINNTGNITAENVTLTENYPAGVVFHNASPPPNISNNVWLIGNLSANQTFEVNITVNVTALSGNLVNSINITFFNSQNASFTEIVTQTTTIRTRGPGPRTSGGGGSAARVAGLTEEEVIIVEEEETEQVQMFEMPEPEPEQPKIVKEKVVVKQEPAKTEVKKSEVKKHVNYKQIFILGTAIALLALLLVLAIKFGTRKKEGTTSELQAKISELKKRMKEFEK